LPDLDTEFWQEYRDADLQVVAIDPGGLGLFYNPPIQTDTLEGVSRYATDLGVTYPIGLETTTTYFQFAKNYAGANPFPLQVLVDKEGVVRYVARQYDPVAVRAMVEQLLAE
jgi:hypothetical protein